VGTLSAGAAIYWNPPWLFPLVILIGGIITIISNRNVDMSAKVSSRRAWEVHARMLYPM
jgi:hypothetical protein